MKGCIGAKKKLSKDNLRHSYAKKFFLIFNKEIFSGNRTKNETSGTLGVQAIYFNFFM